MRLDLTVISDTRPGDDRGDKQDMIEWPGLPEVPKACHITQDHQVWLDKVLGGRELNLPGRIGKPPLIVGHVEERAQQPDAYLLMPEQRDGTHDEPPFDDLG